jgi:hypothetical protein
VRKVAAALHLARPVVALHLARAECALRKKLGICREFGAWGCRSCSLRGGDARASPRTPRRAPGG